MTTLPKPTFLRPVYRVFTADQMREYGAAEYARAIADAAATCHCLVMLAPTTATECEVAIRKLGESK